MRCKSAMVIGSAVLGLILGTSACGDNDDATPDACVDLFAEGTRTPDLDRQPTCTDEGGRSQTISQSRWKCEDGGELFANEYGYGVKGEPWHTDDSDSSGEGGVNPRAGTPLRAAIDACQQGGS